MTLAMGESQPLENITDKIKNNGLRSIIKENAITPWH